MASTFTDEEAEVLREALACFASKHRGSKRDRTAYALRRQVAIAEDLIPRLRTLQPPGGAL